MSGARNGLGAAQRLRVRQFHGFAACPQLVSACHFVESRISADPLVGLCKKGAVSQQELADHLLVTKATWLVSSTGLAPVDSWNGVAPRRTDT